MMPCGHPRAVENHSVETGVPFCGMCRLNEMLNDALLAEKTWRGRAEKHAENLKAERAKVAALVGALGDVLDPVARLRRDAESRNCRLDGMMVAQMERSGGLLSIAQEWCRAALAKAAP
jgi:hypothetical protein